MTLLISAAAAQANEPWWHLESGARPTNLWNPVDEVQEVRAAPAGTATTIKIGATTVACMGSEPTCAAAPGGNSETAAELEAALEAANAYGPGGVEVVEAPAGSRHFKVTTVGSNGGRWMPPLVATGGRGNESARAVVVTDGGSGRLVVAATNVGDAAANAAASPITLIDQLPAGVSAFHAEAHVGTEVLELPITCAIHNADEVSCVVPKDVRQFDAIEVEIWVSVDPPATGAPGEISVTGGGAPDASTGQKLVVSDEKTRFGIEAFSMQAEEPGGELASRAGSHPFQLTTSFELNAGLTEPGKAHKGAFLEQPGLPRNLRFPMPPGFIGNPSTVANCSFQQFTTQLTSGSLLDQCPDTSAVGVAQVSFNVNPLGFNRIAVPVFSLDPNFGEPARFGFYLIGVPVIISSSVNSDREYRISVGNTNTPEGTQLYAATVTIWGNPGDPRHDGARGWNCAFFLAPGACSRPAGLKNPAFLRLPVNCARALEYNAEAEPWNVPLGSVIDEDSFVTPSLVGCGNVPFEPTVNAAPTSKLTTNPSGLDFELGLPNAGLENPEGIAETEPKRVEVDLPEGISINPSEAEGLAVCSEAQYKAEKINSKPGEGCPEASKIGSVISHTPLVEGAIEGSLYIATPHANPFNSLLALYMVARLPEKGVLVKQAGIVKPDPVTGQLRTTFDNLPQLPYSSFKLHFREGGRAPLVTPPACGTYRTQAKFLPYSAADLANPSAAEIVEKTSPFTIERGTDGGGCPVGGTPPFHPGLIAGTINNAAGHYSPFNVRLFRSDSEQEITHFSLKLPPGVTGKLAGIPFCSDQAIALAKSRERDGGGREEQASPSCPAASEIGHTLVGAGVGSVLTYVPGKVYLAGPYKGSNLSIVSITSGVVGPFDVGTVVIREALKVDPETAEVSVDAAGSDPIPHIIDGIPVHLRDIRVYVDRPQFVLNPTSCEPTSVASTVLGSGTNFATEADDRPVTVTTRFQAADCASLGFKPRIKLMLKGPTKRTGLPRLKAVVRPRPGDANIGRAVVTLPRSEFLEQGHIGTTCTRVQFNAGGGNGEQCPAKSVYGRAKAWTPLLSEPLTGPVFLRSNGGERKLPDMVAALHSKDINIDLVGFIKSLHPKGASYSRIRSIFASVPDAPVSRFTLEMFGGKKGLLINSVNLCRGKHRAISKFVGQNGKRDETHPAVRVKCKSKGKRHHKKAHGHSRHTRRGGAHLLGRRRGR